MENKFITDEHTAVLQKLVREIVNDPTTYLGAKYMPSVAIPASRIYVEVLEATGGLANEHVVGSDPLYIQRGGSRVQEFSPPAYKEAIRFDEKDILRLRELGQNDPSRRGIRSYIDRAVDRLNRRIEARIEKLRWDAIFTGGFGYMGKTFSFGVPSAARVSPAIPWFSGVNANTSAKPLEDIRFWLTGGNSFYRKYKVTKMVMNPNTARVILDNPNTQSFIKTRFSADVYPGFDVNTVMKFYMPGAPEIEVYQGWYQSESMDNGTGKLTVGDAIYFIPDGYIFFEANLPDGDMIGEFVQTLHLAGGTVDTPESGKFLVVEENIAPGTRGGPKNPFIDLIGGVYGGPKLDRPFDTLTAYVGE